MDLCLVCPEATGHLNPSLALGQEMAQRGHRVRIVTTPAAAGKIAATGLEHLVVGQSEANEGLAEGALERLGRLSGIRGLVLTTRLIVESSRIIERDLPPQLQNDPCEAILVDQVHPGGATVAETLGLPYVVLCNALAVIINEEIPPATLPWRFSDHRIARWRNKFAYKVGPPLIDFLSGGRNGTSSIALCYGTDRSLAILTQQPAEFDFPVSSGPKHLHHTGPWHSSSRDSDIAFPFERLDGRPLIYASLGTIQNRTTKLFHAIIEAARGLEAQLILSLGRPDAKWEEPLPENVLAVPYAPQLALLQRADLMITHAGMNTAMECLAAGVPMLCLPITNDQPGVARRVEWVGAGKVLLSRNTTPDRLRRMIDELLTDEKYRGVARRFQTQIAETPGPVLAADLIERVLADSTSTRKC